MAFEELKQRQGVMWGAGPFERVEGTIADVHDSLAERIVVQPGESALDVACGTGAMAMRLARTGARVIGVDLAPALVETAKRRAREEGLEIEYEVGDAERLRFEDASFDVVVSSFGAMFAPDPAATARELVRVCRAGGRLGLATWRPDGGVGSMFAMTRPFQPPPPPRVGNPLDWGREEYVEKLLGDAFELTFEERDSVLDSESGEAVWELMRENFGPVKTLADSLGAEPDRLEEFRRAFVDLHETGRDGERIHYSRTYLLTIGRRR